MPVLLRRRRILRGVAINRVGLGSHGRRDITCVPDCLVSVSFVFASSVLVIGRDRHVASTMRTPERLAIDLVVHNDEAFAAIDAV